MICVRACNSSMPATHVHDCSSRCSSSSSGEPPPIVSTWDKALLDADQRARLDKWASLNPGAKGKEGMTVDEIIEELMLRSVSGIRKASRSKGKEVLSKLLLSTRRAQEGEHALESIVEAGAVVKQHQFTHNDWARLCHLLCDPDVADLISKSQQHKERKDFEGWQDSPDLLELLYKKFNNPLNVYDSKRFADKHSMMKGFDRTSRCKSASSGVRDSTGPFHKPIRIAIQLRVA